MKKIRLNAGQNYASAAESTKQNCQPHLSAVANAVRLSILGLGLAHGAVQAATIEVTSHLDNNGASCTLRQAIVSLNSGATLEGGCLIDSGVFGAGDAITFADSLLFPSNTITLNNTQLSIDPNRNISIDASNITGGITVDANNASRVIYANSATLSIDNMTITGGAAGDGGGLYAYSSSISLNNCNVAGNSVSSFGGGIYAYLSQLNVNNTTVSGNSAYSAGGVGVGGSSTVSIISSTVSGNSASDVGGGIDVYSSTLVLSNSTVSGNSAFQGGGIYPSSASVSLNNSTVSGNSAHTGGGLSARSESSVSLSNSIIGNSVGGDDIHLIGGSTLSSDFASIIEEASFGGSRTGDPGLLSLANNGGATLTHALNVGSPAIGTANASKCPTLDQRGEPRDGAGGFFLIKTSNGKAAVIPVDGECDVGAVEFNSNDAA